MPAASLGQEVSKDPSAVLDFTLGLSADGDGTAGSRNSFAVEFSKSELQALLEKLDRVQSQLDALGTR